MFDQIENDNEMEAITRLEETIAEIQARVTAYVKHVTPVPPQEFAARIMFDQIENDSWMNELFADWHLTPRWDRGELREIKYQLLILTHENETEAARRVTRLEETFAEIQARVTAYVKYVTPVPPQEFAVHMEERARAIEEENAREGLNMQQCALAEMGRGYFYDCDW